MNLIDTHTHLYDPQFDDDRSDMVQRAIDAGVEQLFLPNCDLETLPRLLDMVAQWPQHCYPMLGLHPCYVDAQYKEALDAMEALRERHPWVAIGEIGLDFHWDISFAAEQQIVFEQQIDWALEMDLPIVIHTRKALPEAIHTVEKKQNGNLKGIFHCFGGSREEARAIAGMGFMMGIGGIATFKNSPLKELLPHIGLHNIVLETDAPYLAPVPYRGKRNESSYLRHIAGHIADILEIQAEQVAEITTRNAQSIFKNSN